MANSIEIILNKGSGSHEAQDSHEILTKIFRESGRSFAISVASGEEISRLAQEKAKSDCEVLVAGGGDGTICGVAEAAREHGKTLGVLPLGTFNYFAKNLGIPLELEEAARVILEGESVRASVLDLDGRLILNNSSIGIHPAVLMQRRKLYRRWGRNQLNAYLSVLITASQPAPRLRVRLATDEGEVVRETPLVMICSNAFQMEEFALAGRECLAEEKFALYVARMAGRTTIFRLGMRALFRCLRPGIDYEVICTSDVTIETLRRRRLRAAVDGELQTLNSPMRFQVAPQPLCVLAPREKPGG
ncbi:MAG TPA: diacylglycerol kinase family protein [Chthoniobacterales bacterium]|jgi:diacylglycerol kinase family enzyme